MTDPTPSSFSLRRLLLLPIIVALVVGIPAVVSRGREFSRYVAIVTMVFSLELCGVALFANRKNWHILTAIIVIVFGTASLALGLKPSLGVGWGLAAAGPYVIVGIATLLARKSPEACLKGLIAAVMITIVSTWLLIPYLWNEPQFGRRFIAGEIAAILQYGVAAAAAIGIAVGVALKERALRRLAKIGFAITLVGALLGLTMDGFCIVDQFQRDAIPPGKEDTVFVSLLISFPILYVGFFCGMCSLPNRWGVISVGLAILTFVLNCVALLVYVA